MSWYSFWFGAVEDLSVVVCFQNEALRLPAMVATWAVECCFVEWRQNGVILKADRAFKRLAAL